MSGRITTRLRRLHSLYPKLIDLSLERLERLLATLGHPERRLPPVIHVAGTNGKGSCCAFLRAIGEASGWRVHVYTSPHLVRFNERIRLAGRLASDSEIDAALAEAERVNAGQPITVFEIITAAAFLLFAAEPADLTVLEVGLGGRADATNVVPPPAAAAITSISLDHREFLGETLAAIAAEKAGIFKVGAPAITGEQPAEALEVLTAHAASLGISLGRRGAEWRIAEGPMGLCYEDRFGRLELPPPALRGPWQADNAGIAIAAMRAAEPRLPQAAFAEGLRRAEWPGRMQRLRGVLPALLSQEWELWLDGGHNPGAGAALAEYLAAWWDRPLYLIVGMKTGKDASGFLRPLLPFAASVYAVAEPGQHLAMPPSEIIAATGGRVLAGPTVRASLRALARSEPPGRVLICGSLYLAGQVLKADRALVPA